MSMSTPTPDADMIGYAAKVIMAEREKPNTAPYHWAGALYEAGMLVPPGHGGLPYPYPYETGDVIVLGPDTFVAADRTVISHKGENYYPRPRRPWLRRGWDIVWGRP